MIDRCSDNSALYFTLNNSYSDLLPRDKTVTSLLDFPGNMSMCTVGYKEGQIPVKYLNRRAVKRNSKRLADELHTASQPLFQPITSLQINNGESRESLET